MSDILLGGYYKHYKNKFYRVLEVAKHSEELQNYAVYQALYKNELAQTWVRPLDMFQQKVNGRDRFELVSPPHDFTYYHSHIYFDTQTREVAAVLHRKFNDINVPVQLSKMIDKPIGPHPLPMFEVDFKSEHFLEIIDFLQKNRNGLSVLIHPLSGSEILDHTEYAMFLGGNRQPLNLSVFDHIK